MRRCKLCIVIPCFNEEEVLPVTAPMFRKELQLLMDKCHVSDDSRILFVDDGSNDKTWDIICSLSNKDSSFMGIRQSRNRGHQSSVLAGLMEALPDFDITISVDCDGQDDLHAMEQMVQAYQNGCEVVYGVRNDRSSDSVFKRSTAQGFYHLMQFMGADVVYNHADYRLISSRVLQEFSDFKEVNLFLRGMIPLVGFPSTSVYYERHERLAGKSHYPLKKMVGLALDGITSLSIKPIRLITGLGLFVAAISFIGVVWSIFEFFLGKTVSGWASMTSIICFVSGVQLISLGVIGEYIGKIYLETKKRPRFIISERTDNMWKKKKQEAGK